MNFQHFNQFALSNEQATSIVGGAKPVLSLPAKANSAAYAATGVPQVENPPLPPILIIDPTPIELPILIIDPVTYELPPLG
jgi:hypothetical protein